MSPAPAFVLPDLGDAPVDFAGLRFDQFVYCDHNGVALSPVSLLSE